MSLIEALVAVFALYLIADILNNVLREEVQVSKRIHRFSSSMSTLLIFLIILSIRLLLESLSHYYIFEEYYLFRYLTNDFFLFAIMVTMFLPFYAIFLKRFSKNILHDDENIPKKFGGLPTQIIVGSIFLLIGIVGAIFLLIGINIPNIELKLLMFFAGGITFNFAIMGSISSALYFFFLMRLEKDKLPDDENIIQSEQFRRLYIKFIIVAWIVGAIFLSSSLLQISLESGDIIYLGFIWAMFAVGLAIVVTSLVNKARPIETRIPKFVLNRAMYTGGLIAFGIWSIQLVIVELYLRRLFGVTLYIQDIRILIVVVNAVYVIVYAITLKKIFKPRALERSEEKLQKAIELYEKKQGEEEKRIGSNVILDVQDLTTYFYTEEGIVKAVEGVSFKINEGENLGLVGETGCGKSVTALSILQLIRPPGIVEKGKVIFRGEDLLQKSTSEVLGHRGKDITMIFQDPLNSLNPVFKIGAQITEVYLLHMENELLLEASKQDKNIFAVAREWSEQLLQDLNIPFPDLIFDLYPHELSGGMRQRVQIAMGLACSPKLLIADEPTTALDVTIQNQILKLMKELKSKYNTSMLFITHDLGIISKMCDRVAVMYSGSIVEYGNIQKLFIKPYHPYTRGLISSVPIVGKKRRYLQDIKGTVPNLIYPPSGCRFHPRCNYCFEPCDSKIPKSIEVEPDYFVACHLYDPEYKELSEISIKKAEEN